MSCMRHRITRRTGRVGGAPLLLLALLAPDVAPAAPPLYWCPNAAPDRQYRAAPGPGCTLLIEQEQKPTKKASGQEQKKPVTRPPIADENFQREIVAFLRKYRAFADCCAANPDSLPEVEALEDEAVALLEAAQGELFSEQMKLRGFTFREIIPPLAQARDALRTLKARLEQIRQSLDKLPTLDYEGAARERRKIQQEEAAIAEEFRPVPPPAAPRTGTEIGGAVGTGPTSLPNRVGTQFGATTLPGRVGSAIGPDQSGDLKPRTGPDAKVDLDREAGTTLPNRAGTATESTTLRPTTGFEIEAPEGPTGKSSLPTRVGPSVGDSSLNNP